MSDKILLTDTMTIKLSRVESADGTGKLKARGEFARAGVPTANKRVYPEALWSRELTRLNESISQRKMFGELDHPADGKTKLSRASHLVTNLQADKDGVIIGEAEVMDTEAGKTLKAILDAGGSIGVSSRGYGSVKMNEQGHDVVQDDYQLLTFDFVADPANGTSYPAFTVEGKDKKEGVMIVDAIKTNEPVVTAPVVDSAKVATPLNQMTIESHQKIVDEQKQKFTAELIVTVNEAKEKLKEEITAELMSDPKIAGAKVALESVKNILRPYVLGEDAEAVVAHKEDKIRELTTQLETKDKELKEKAKYVEDITKMARDLGYNLYLERKLSKHPKFEDIVTGLGDFSKIESIGELQGRVKVFEDELPTVLKQAEEKINGKLEHLEHLNSQLAAHVESKQIEMQKLSEERDEAISIGLESSSRAYMEKKIMGNPKSPEIRNMFESLEQKTKGSVDRLIGQFEVKSSGGRDFDRIRNRLGKVPSASLVEDSLKGTIMDGVKGTFQVAEGFVMPMEQLKALSGMAK